MSGEVAANTGASAPSRAQDRVLLALVDRRGNAGLVTAVPCGGLAQQSMHASRAVQHFAHADSTAVYRPG